MKKILVIPALFLLFLFFIPEQTSAAPESSCIGETTGVVGECQIFCGPSLRADGNEGCGFAQKCCVSPEEIPGEGVPCRGLESGELGSCQVFCGPSLRADGVNPPNDLCSPGQKCCVSPAVIEGGGEENGDKGPLTGCPGENEINTAIGCIPIGNTNEFIGFILRWAIGIANNDLCWQP